MALNLSSRAARTACAASKIAARPIATVIPSRTYATSPEENQHDKPRWSYTPSQAKAPFSLHLHSKRPAFHVNSDPVLLDRFYIRLFGNGGDQVLSEETKWLAVTHKSFDQGRRGYNDRLAFLGKRIVQLQASLALAQNVPAGAQGASPAEKDEFGRVPFTHAALDGLNNLSSETKKVLTERAKLAELAEKYDLQKVVRWSPKRPDDLRASGIELVLANTLYAVIGAVSLEKGGLVANQIARERILDPLGIKSVS
ncbi:hypothetical protein N7452_003408 [Penicillium brevicompactum]|uniref:RNase III domain-containing protein n=1 Tax=Penicillium brevicompactum TaxID=5074 RepID=A0A9W9QV09_PENBR|nr:hypothetical protein N7452_003408 [Penicillium brevicompactum]